MAKIKNKGGTSVDKKKKTLQAFWKTILQFLTMLNPDSSVGKEST